MGKVKVFALAKKLGFKSAEFVGILKNIGFPVNSYQASLEEWDVPIIEERLRKGGLLKDGDGTDGAGLGNRLNSTATEVTGYYELRTHTSNVPLGDQELIDSGDFRMRLRDSLNEASAIQLAGTWSGLGYDLDSEYQGNARSLVSLLSLNEFGTITAGALYLDGDPFRNFDLGGGNTGLFSLLTFPTLGRFDDVVLILDDNETLTFDFLLVDVEEGLISGPVVDSVRPTTELVFRVKYVIE